MSLSAEKYRVSLIAPDGIGLAVDAISLSRRVAEWFILETTPLFINGVASTRNDVLRWYHTATNPMVEIVRDSAIEDFIEEVRFTASGP